MSKIALPPASAATDGPRLEDRLRAAGYDVVITDRWTDADLRPLFGDVDVVVASPARKYPVELFQAAPRMRLITSPVIGVDTIDIDAANEFGVLVSNCPTMENINGIAEATVMFMVALLLKLKQKERSLREGHFRPRHASHLLWGRTVGLIGYGRIARQVEQRLQGWGVTIQAADPYVAGTLPLDQLLRTSDVVSVHVVLTSETRNMIGARELALMKPSAIVINTSRGGAIVEEDLAEAINSERIAGAALDVFQQEPINMDNPLLACDPERVILTPHSIGHNLESGPTGIQMALDNIERALRGELPESVINPEVVPAWRRRLALLS
ncbi:MAG: dehydrogenase [Chloroflexi bacterium]|nr:dehydrogenase [Chloroflexota bacterium]MBV9597082.1 dehydrogenase [Chloroflexota bacterium]